MPLHSGPDPTRALNLSGEVVALLRDNAFDRKIAPRLAALDRYSTDQEAWAVPRNLIAPTTGADFFALTQQERREVIVERVRADHRAKRAVQRKRSRMRARPSK